MSLTFSAAAARISRQVIESETAIADAIANTSELIATMARAQITVANAPRASGQVALHRAQAAARKLAEAQGEMLRAHAQLADIGRTMMSPEEDYCPPSAFDAMDVTDRAKRAA